MISVEKQQQQTNWNSPQYDNEICRMKDEQGYKGSSYSMYDSKSGFSMDVRTTLT